MHAVLVWDAKNSEFLTRRRKATSEASVLKVTDGNKLGLSKRFWWQRILGKTSIQTRG